METLDLDAVAIEAALDQRQRIEIKPGRRGDYCCAISALCSTTMTARPAAQSRLPLTQSRAIACNQSSGSRVKLAFQCHFLASDEAIGGRIIVYKSAAI